DKLRGEMILLIAPCEEEKIISDEEITNLLEKLVKEMTIKDAVDIVTSELNLPKKHIYKLALKMKNEK
ncbi:hypothetical protein ACSLVQ_31120, partial [Klebsiella pneumoniae]|uniref:hypothetical protein n=1 Tax=Klebsiella pneumoniae TaxID=573 RepID=UPI003EDFA982